MPIELTANRTIAFKSAGHDYALTLAPITKSQWLTYFAAIESTSERVKGNLVESFNSTNARLQLVTSAMIDATGYRVGSGVDIVQVPGWKELIPTSHRLAAANTLISVERSPADDDEAILLGVEVISLDALWCNAEGEMVKVCGLKHAFATPTVEQHGRYSRDMSRSMIVGGSRSGKTRWIGAQPTLVALYDELITAVSGYSVSDQALTFENPERETVIRTMDTFHKVAAAEALFAPVQPDLKEAE